MSANAKRANLLPPTPEEPQKSLSDIQQVGGHDLWEAVDAEITEAIVDAVKSGIETGDWANGRQAIRAWIMQHRRELINPLIEKNILSRVIMDFIEGEHDLLAMLDQYQN